MHVRFAAPRSSLRVVLLHTRGCVVALKIHRSCFGYLTRFAGGAPTIVFSSPSQSGDVANALSMTRYCCGVTEPRAIRRGGATSYAAVRRLRSCVEGIGVLQCRGIATLVERRRLGSLLRHLVVLRLVARDRRLLIEARRVASVHLVRFLLDSGARTVGPSMSSGQVGAGSGITSSVVCAFTRSTGSDSTRTFSFLRSINTATNGSASSAPPLAAESSEELAVPHSVTTPPTATSFNMARSIGSSTSQPHVGLPDFVGELSSALGASHFDPPRRVGSTF